VGEGGCWLCEGVGRVSVCGFVCSGTRWSARVSASDWMRVAAVVTLYQHCELLYQHCELLYQHCVLLYQHLCTTVPVVRQNRQVLLQLYALRNSTSVTLWED
jgi:hypothetical protein